MLNWPLRRRTYGARPACPCPYVKNTTELGSSCGRDSGVIRDIHVYCNFTSLFALSATTRRQVAGRFTKFKLHIRGADMYGHESGWKICNGGRHGHELDRVSGAVAVHVGTTRNTLSRAYGARCTCVQRHLSKYARPRPVSRIPVASPGDSITFATPPPLSANASATEEPQGALSFLLLAVWPCQRCSTCCPASQRYRSAYATAQSYTHVAS
ncbi:hypothetical protein EXIGLDRAFT_177454 [Exidia glandulosa HHB12029]|uniref:Uncharacterized protein n=1 Tax=Exidia glandulosa HHB12029 TaxID=1314781 RepID=A0A165F4L0_EXIGL|nr:hypothetical protein EXIGLDRAFT_177454 [Exidia glandulosa HHB12029]